MRKLSYPCHYVVVEKNLLLFIVNVGSSDLGTWILYLPLELPYAGFSCPRTCHSVRNICQLHKFSAKNRQMSRWTGRRSEWSGIHLYSCSSGLVNVTFFCLLSIEFCLSWLYWCSVCPIYSACKEMASGVCFVVLDWCMFPSKVTATT